MYITAYFTNAWTPITWLTPSISVIKLSDDSVVDSWTMSEISWGYYKYNFTTFDSSTEYLYTIDWWSALNNADRYKSWVTPAEINESNLHTYLDSYTNKKDWKATPVTVSDTSVSRFELEELLKKLQEDLTPKETINLENIVKLIKLETQKNIPKQEKIDLWSLENKLDKIIELNKIQKIKVVKKIEKKVEKKPQVTKKEINLLEKLLKPTLLESLLEEPLLDRLLKNPN